MNILTLSVIIAIWIGTFAAFIKMAYRLAMTILEWIWDRVDDLIWFLEHDFRTIVEACWYSWVTLPRLKKKTRAGDIVSLALRLMKVKPRPRSWVESYHDKNKNL